MSSSTVLPANCLLPALPAGPALGLQDPQPAGETDGEAGRKHKKRKKKKKEINKTSTPPQNKQTNKKSLKNSRAYFYP